MGKVQTKKNCISWWAFEICPLSSKIYEECLKNLQTFHKPIEHSVGKCYLLHIFLADVLELKNNFLACPTCLPGGLYILQMFFLYFKIFFSD